MKYFKRIMFIHALSNLILGMTALFICFNYTKVPYTLALITLMLFAFGEYGRRWTIQQNEYWKD